MADTFTSTVDATVATFQTLWEIGGRTIEAAGNVSVRPLPYGGGVVIQSAGRLPVYRTLRLRVASQAELTNLLHCRGDHGTLSTTESGSVDCTLTQVTSSWVNWDLQLNEVEAHFVNDTLP